MKAEDYGGRRNWRDNMQVSVSKMEIELRIELARRGIHPMTSKSFCVISTTPDFTFPVQRKAFYVDGEKVHLKRQERDGELRELLEKRHDYRVESFSYKRYSKGRMLEIADQIEEALKG